MQHSPPDVLECSNQTSSHETERVTERHTNTHKDTDRQGEGRERESPWSRTTKYIIITEQIKEQQI